MNSKKEALKKVTGGKTVKIELTTDNETIKEVIISGDFFAFPIEKFEELERSLEGVKARIDEVKMVLNNFKQDLTLVGISWTDLEELFESLLE